MKTLTLAFGILAVLTGAASAGFDEGLAAARKGHYGAQRNIDRTITLISDNREFYPSERLSDADAEPLKALGGCIGMGG